MLARTYGAEGVKAIELVGELRQQPTFDEDLALVVERDGTPLASAMLAPVALENEGDTVADCTVLASLAFDTKQPEVEPVAVLNAVLKTVEQGAAKYIFMRGNAADFAGQGFEKADGVTIANSTEQDWLVKPLKGAEQARGTLQLPAVLLK